MLDETEFEQLLIELMFGHEAADRGAPEAEAYRSALDLYTTSSPVCARRTSARSRSPSDGDLWAATMEPCVAGHSALLQPSSPLRAGAV